jgi:hypothetical protein
MNKHQHKQAESTKAVQENKTTVKTYHLCQFPLAPEENPKMFPTAIHEQNIAFAELR